MLKGNLKHEENRFIIFLIHSCAKMNERFVCHSSQFYNVSIKDQQAQLGSSINIAHGKNNRKMSRTPHSMQNIFNHLKSTMWFGLLSNSITTKPRFLKFNIIIQCQNLYYSIKFILEIYLKYL
jgi:hypothetical protein